MTALRLATRASALARWQADYVAERLLHSAGVRVDLVPMTTEGDRRLDVPLTEIGGKGVFVKEVQAAVLDGRADFAVHSAKDLPAVTPDGLVIVAVPERADPRDALVGSTIEALPVGGVVATGSRRRAAQLLALRPDLNIVGLRGNIATRLEKVSDVDAVVVAVAALDRLGLAERITEYLDPTVMVPQVGQGTLAIECRADDPLTSGILATIDDPVARRLLDAERAFLVELGGDCDLPAGAFARIDHALSGSSLESPVGVGDLSMSGVLLVDEQLRSATVSGLDGVQLGTDLARQLAGR